MAAYNPTPSQQQVNSVQPSFANPESLKSLLTSPQAPPITMPPPVTTTNANATQSYSTYTPRPAYDNCEFDFASILPSI